jgi:type I restriction enzyme S subunit
LYSCGLNIPAIKQTTGIQNLDTDAYFNQRVPFPPLPQQRAIADYLDRETARLDALVAAKERVLRLLAEKRLALVSGAVTRGLDPRAQFRDSGIPWLGEIPAHWDLCHLKRVLSSIDYGISDSVEHVGTVAILRMGDIQDGEVDYSKLGFVDSVDQALLLRPGDLLFNRTNSLDQIGKVALFRGRPDHPVSFASYLVRLRCGPRVLPEFLNWLLNSAFTVAWGRSEALPAIGQANLNPNRYGYLPMALPPLEEQRDIVAAIHGAAAKLEAVRAATERTIALLKERRAALIAAAVKGEIDVESAA